MKGGSGAAPSFLTPPCVTNQPTTTREFAAPYGTGKDALFKPLSDEDVKFYTGKVRPCLVLRSYSTAARCHTELLAGLVGSDQMAHELSNPF